MKFTLNFVFVAEYQSVSVDWGPVGEITYRRTYSRDGEEWYETCARVVAGCYEWQRSHCVREGMPWDDDKAQHSAQEMYKLMFDFKFLPPGRGLFTMGVPGLLEKTGAAANNCGFVSTKNLDNDFAGPFCWAMDHLMLGVGVGFDCLGSGFAVGAPSKQGWTHTVGDSREGWVDALRELLCSYFHLSQKRVLFDYSEVRPEGSPVGFGGTASGPGPLEEMLESIRSLLDHSVTLSSGDIVDIMNLIGRCIVSGNIRRSAEIAFGDSDDKEFMRLKDKQLFPSENASHRWAANHSVICEVGDDYGQLLANTAGADELGVMWIDNARRYSRMGRRPTNLDSRAAGANPCAEQTLEDKELCCLVEVFPSRHSTYYEFQRTLKYAYLYAKTVTLIPVHNETTDEIIKRNRRIGCSLTGIQQAITKHGHREFYGWCGDGYKFLKSLDDRYSAWLHVPRSIKLTSVKPSGTVSKLPGVSAGIHFPPAQHYFQVIRFATNSPYVRAYRDAGYRCVDLAPDEPNTTAIYFAVSEENFSRAEKDVSIWEQAMHAISMQHYWADNQVSITVKYETWERPQLEHVLNFAQFSLKSVSFFPKSGHSFAHAPWQPVDRTVLDYYRSKLKKVRLSSVHERTDLFCDGESCEIPTKG